MTGISGTTRIVHVVADPVFQLRTPRALNMVWEERGLDFVTVPAHVSDADLALFLQSLRINASVAGAVVTVPHKQAAAGLCDALEPNASLTGAVNAIRRTRDGRLVGETFDGLGFVAGLRSEGIEPTGLRVLIMGAGGAACAIAFALASAGAASIAVTNRTPAKAQSLADRLRQSGFDEVSTGFGEASTQDLVINATSVGMYPGQDVEFDVERFSPEAVAAEVIVSDDHTPFLARAVAHGMGVHGGQHMLQGQMNLIADFLSSREE